MGVFCDTRGKDIQMNDPVLKEVRFKKMTCLYWLVRLFYVLAQNKMANLHDKSADVCQEVVWQWISQLPAIYEGYYPKTSTAVMKLAFSLGGAPEGLAVASTKIFKNTSPSYLPAVQVGKVEVVIGGKGLTAPNFSEICIRSTEDLHIQT